VPCALSTIPRACVCCLSLAWVDLHYCAAPALMVCWAALLLANVTKRTTTMTGASLAEIMQVLKVLLSTARARCWCSVLVEGGRVELGTDRCRGFFVLKN